MIQSTLSTKSTQGHQLPSYSATQLLRRSCIERRAREHLTAVREDDAACVGHVALPGILRPEAVHGDLVAFLERIAVPAAPHQAVRRTELEIPLLDLARFVGAAYVH